MESPNNVPDSSIGQSANTAILQTGISVSVSAKNATDMKKTPGEGKYFLQFALFSLSPLSLNEVKANSM